MYQSRTDTEALKKAYPHLFEPIKLKPAPPDPTIPEISGPTHCPKCGVSMVLLRPWHDEKFYREYWKCYTKGCMKKIQIDDDGYPIIEPKGETTDEQTEPNIDPENTQTKFII